LIRIVLTAAAIVVGTLAILILSFREQNFRNNKIGALLQGRDSKVRLPTLVGEK